MSFITTVKKEGTTIKMTEIYYIEDDKSIAQSVKEYLEQYDFRVTVYGTITDARTAIVKMRPQLILLDWNMPDGRETECAVLFVPSGVSCRLSS